MRSAVTMVILLLLLPIVLGAPTVTSISPIKGPLEGGMEVTLVGTDLNAQLSKRGYFNAGGCQAHLSDQRHMHGSQRSSTWHGFPRRGHHRRRSNKDGVAFLRTCRPVDTLT